MASPILPRATRMWPAAPDTTANDTALAEYALLSLPVGSTMTVEQLLSDFPLQFVAMQRTARA